MRTRRHPIPSRGLLRAKSSPRGGRGDSANPGAPKPGAGLTRSTVDPREHRLPPFHLPLEHRNRHSTGGAVIPPVGLKPCPRPNRGRVSLQHSRTHCISADIASPVVKRQQGRGRLGAVRGNPTRCHRNATTGLPKRNPQIAVQLIRGGGPTGQTHNPPMNIQAVRHDEQRALPQQSRPRSGIQLPTNGGLDARDPPGARKRRIGPKVHGPRRHGQRRALGPDSPPIRPHRRSPTTKGARGGEVQRHGSRHSEAPRRPNRREQQGMRSQGGNPGTQLPDRHPPLQPRLLTHRRPMRTLPEHMLHSILKTATVGARPRDISPMRSMSRRHHIPTHKRAQGPYSIRVTLLVSQGQPGRSPVHPSGRTGKRRAPQGQHPQRHNPPSVLQPPHGLRIRTSRRDPGHRWSGGARNGQPRKGVRTKTQSPKRSPPRRSHGSNRLTPSYLRNLLWGHPHPPQGLRKKQQRRQSKRSRRVSRPSRTPQQQLQLGGSKPPPTPNSTPSSSPQPPQKLPRWHPSHSPIRGHRNHRRSGEVHTVPVPTWQTRNPSATLNPNLRPLSQHRVPLHGTQPLVHSQILHSQKDRDTREQGHKPRAHSARRSKDPTLNRVQGKLRSHRKPLRRQPSRSHSPRNLRRGTHLPPAQVVNITTRTGEPSGFHKDRPSMGQHRHHSHSHGAARRHPRNRVHRLPQRIGRPNAPGKRISLQKGAR